MSFNLKPQGSTTQHSSNAPQVDWNAINKQVETDNHTAVISQIVDLGIHTPPLSANIEKSTELDTREEAEALVAQVETMLKKSDFEKVKNAALNFDESKENSLDRKQYVTDALLRMSM